MSKRKIITIEPVEAMTGKLSNRKTDSNLRYSVPRFYIGFQRKTGNNNFFQARVNLRSTPAKQSELDKRDQFRIVAAAVRTILNDPVKSAALMEEYRGQDKYRTFRGFVFAKGWYLYDPQTKTVIWD